MLGRAQDEFAKRDYERCITILNGILSTDEYSPYVTAPSRKAIGPTFKAAPWSAITKKATSPSTEPLTKNV